MSKSWRTLTGLAVVSLTLTGCGGGAYLSYEYVDGPDPYVQVDQAPTVQLSASQALATPGAVLTLVTAVTDDHGVRHVDFYLRDARGDIPLGRDTQGPFSLTTQVPATSSQVVVYVARAVDDAGQSSNESALVLPTGY